MREYIDKIIEVEKKISEELGEFNLFVLFEREDIKDRWDILISMPFSEEMKNEIITKIHSELLKVLPNEAVIKLSRIVMFETSNPIVESFNMLAKVKHGNVEIKDSLVSNIRIKQALLITSQRFLTTVEN
jgi:hypothetical protein